MITRIAQIMEDVFDIPASRVELSDHLRIDWGMDDNEIRAFNAEFCAEFGIPIIPTGLETVGDYVKIISHV